MRKSMQFRVRELPVWTIKTSGCGLIQFISVQPCLHAYKTPVLTRDHLIEGIYVVITSLVMNLYFKILLLLFLATCHSAISLPPSLCGGALSTSSPSFILLNRVCEYCYYITKDHEIFNLCREDCFINEYFFSCLNATFADNDTRGDAGRSDEGVQQLLKLYFQCKHWCQSMVIIWMELMSRRDVEQYKLFFEILLFIRVLL